ncbi:MAG: hypothetical protein AAFU64_01135, partial [Bacteroidota bacterium]
VPASSSPKMPLRLVDQEYYLAEAFCHVFARWMQSMMDIPLPTFGKDSINGDSDLGDIHEPSGVPIL